MKKIVLLLLTLIAMTSCGNSPKQDGDLRSCPWQEIQPEEIDLNPVQMIDGDWLEVSAGKEGKMNLMTISWGTIGELWNKPVFIVYVSTSRYTHQFMEDNDCFTVTHFPASMREQLAYLGRVSGRNEDKVAGAGLTVEFTELGNPIYAEADLAIECKKLYGQQFDASLMPAEQQAWYEQLGLGIHYMYIGEILHVWKKSPVAPAAQLTAADPAQYQSHNPENMQRVRDFLKKTGVYFLATEDGDQPQVRPFGTAEIFEGKLYIQTGHVKNVAKQIAANPKAAICAFDGSEWLRITATLVEDPRVEIKKAMLDAYPDLRAMYDENDGNTAVYYLKDAKATISAFTHAPIEIDF